MLDSGFSKLDEKGLAIAPSVEHQVSGIQRRNFLFSQREGAHYYLINHATAC